MKCSTFDTERGSLPESGYQTCSCNSALSLVKFTGVCNPALSLVKLTGVKLRGVKLTGGKLRGGKFKWNEGRGIVY